MVVGGSQNNTGFRVKVFRIVFWGPLLEQDVVRAVTAESLYK